MILSILLTVGISLVVLAIILKILGRHPFVNLVIIFGCALALLIYGYTVGPKHDQGLTGAVQGTLFFAYLVFGYADVAFDRDYYYETTVTYNEWSDSYDCRTRLTSSSNFWGCVGISAFIGYGVSFLLNLSLTDGNRVMAIIGIVCTVWSAFRLLTFIFGYIRARR